MYRLDVLLLALSELMASKRFVRFRDVVGSPLPAGCAVLRFDVERDLSHHLRLATELAGRGIAATMYFHTRRACFDPQVLMAIQDAGHEVGYHHECLDRCRGDMAAARELFLREVEGFRSHDLVVSTCCSHGEPGLRKVGYQSNWDLFETYPDLLDEAGLSAEMYLWLRHHEVTYATDTFVGYPRFFSTLRSVTKNDRPSMILVHPHRWRNRFWTTAAEIFLDVRQHASNRILRRRRYDVVPFPTNGNSL